MEPFYFGEQEQTLLGLYHPPTVPAKDNAVLICPPLFGEYMRTHGCLRKLAIELSSRGSHVLRFDYSGTGDSGGELQDASVARWIHDIRCASAELSAISGAPTITGVGVRVGATLLAQAAPECPAIRRLVLWDPVDDGESWVRGLEKTYASLIASHEHLPAPDVEQARSRITGYSLPQGLAAELAALTVTPACFTGLGLSVLLTDSSVFESGRWQGFIDACELVEHDCDWSTFSESVLFGHSLIPQLARQAGPRA